MTIPKTLCYWTFPVALACLFGNFASAQIAAPSNDNVKVLMLGDTGHHQPASLFRTIAKPLADVGVAIEYSDDTAATLKPERLNQFDVLLIYANTTKITEDQEKALLDYVASGRGFVPLHCATYCFLNSEKYIELCGGQFKEHGGQRFSTQIVAPEHELMKGFGGFESWDETYVHHKHNTVNRIVLEERSEGKLAEGTKSEPWTWVRTHGKGRVFYTAWGHNIDTWQQTGFHNLLERGIKWSAGKSLANVAPFSDSKRFPIPKMTTVATDLPKFTFKEVGGKIPNYTPGKRWGVQGDLISTMQNPVAPKESEKHYVTPESFEMKLWASESDPAAGGTYAGLSGKPLAMNWDHRGRLWVCETVDYPNDLQPPGKGRDRIRICEDTDHDGMADKFTVFATNMSIPSAIVCVRGGALIQDGQKTVFLKDTTGDDVADMRQELITGWEMGDTHGGVSNFNYGVDNWIWAMQGYNDSTPVINGVKQQRFRQGFWRFAIEAGASDETAPVFSLAGGKAADSRTKEFDSHSIRVTKLEFIRSSNNNTWGFGQSEEGLIFGSTANGTPSMFMPIANQYYERVNGWSPEVLASMADSNNFNPVTPNVRQVDFHGGSTAGCGHALYTARKYPKSWWNRVAFVCEPTGHLVGTFVIDRNGAGYRSTNSFNLAASNDEWSSPTMAEVGPDGNVWVLDFYNFIIQHNPTPQGFSTGKGNAYESELRDKKYGRIYRVVYNGSEGMDKAALEAADKTILKGLDPSNESALIAALKHPTMLWRKHAQRLLIEKGALDNATMQALQALVVDPTVDSNELNVGAIHALWVLNAMKPTKAVALVAPRASTMDIDLASALKHKSAGVRRNAIQVSPNSPKTLDAILAAGLLNDADPQVRLAALLKVADIPASNEGVLSVLARPDLVSQLKSATATTTDRWLLDAWTTAAATHAKALLPILITQKDWQPSEVVLKQIGVVAQHAARSKMDSTGIEKFIVTPGTPSVAATIIRGLVAGWPKDYEISVSKSAGDKLLALWLNGSLPIESKSQVLQLATSFGVKDLGEGLDKIKQELITVFGDAKKDTESRVAAAKQLIVLQPESSNVVSDILAQVTPQSAPELSSGMVQALSSSRAKGMASMLIERSRTLPPDFRKNAIRVMLSRTPSTLELLDLMEGNKLSISDLQLDQKQALREHPDAKVKEKALAVMKNSGGVPNSDRQKVLDAWMSITEEAGNAGSGKAMYEKHCAACHKHGDLGVNIGPNLTGMSVHPKHELLMNILDPSRSVEGNFRTYSIRTTDSIVLTGMLAGESKTSIEIINAQGKKEVVLRDDIEELIASQKSLMPEGFEGQMSKVEMRDLLEFLASKGKYVPLPIDKVATSTTTKGMFFDEKGLEERMVFSDWSPKTFKDVPFVLVDPQGDKVPNAIMLYGPNGVMAPKMPKEVELTCQTAATAIHMLSGVGGWSFPASQKGSVSMIVRLVYANGKTEDHPLINGVHFADYINRTEVPKSEFAYNLRGKQIRYLTIKPESREPLSKIQLVKGPDASAPIVMAITVQTIE